MSKGSHQPVSSCWDVRTEKRVQDQSLEETEESAVETAKGWCNKGEKECIIRKAKTKGISGRRGWLAASDPAERASDHWV